MDNAKIRIQSDINESSSHVNAKNVITNMLLTKTVKLINYKGKELIINPSDINEIRQEFTWYYKFSSNIFRKSYIADIIVLDNANNIKAIIEIVNTHRLTEEKFTFYESLNCFWIELDANYVLSNTNYIFENRFQYKGFSNCYSQKNLHYRR